MADAATCFEYYGGLATKIHGEVLPVPDNALSLRAARADRRGRADHSLELPAADGGLEARAGARAGCTTVLKPAEQTPLTLLELAEDFEASGSRPAW